MDAVIRVAAMYLFLLLVFRIAGNRSLSEATTFDLALLLIISETTQQAMVGEDHSFIHAFLLIMTFFTLNIGLSLIKQHSKTAERLIEGLPLILVEDGRPFRERLDKSRVDEDDILEAARSTLGLERLDQIKYAVLERGGSISIVPKESARRRKGEG